MWMVLEGIILTEERKTKLYDFTYVWNQKMKQIQKHRLMAATGRTGGMGERGEEDKEDKEGHTLVIRYLIMGTKAQCREWFTVLQYLVVW